MSSIPCQDDINLLYNNYYRLKILRGTKILELLIQKTNLPGISISDQPQPTIFGTTIPVPTLGIQFEPLSVEFLVDKNLNNWKSIYSWMRNISNIENDVDHNLEYQKWHYNAALQIFDNSPESYKCDIPLLTVEFGNLIPVKLSGLIFQSDNSDTVQLRASCTFKYSFYNLNPDAPSNLFP